MRCRWDFLHRASIGSDEPHIEVTDRGDSEYLLRWTQFGPVDVFVSPLPDAKVSAMRRLATDVRKSEYESPSLDIRRPYFLLRAADGATYRTAERLVPLQGGSNFRDLGGYPGAGGKHLRWGLMFRSAAMPKLTDADYQFIVIAEDSNRCRFAVTRRAPVIPRRLASKTQAPNDCRKLSGRRFV